MRINLIKEEKKQITFDFFGVGLLLIVLIPIMMIGIIHYSLISEKNYVQNEITNIENRLEVYLPREREYKEYEKVIAKLKEIPKVPDYNWDGPIEVLGYITPLKGVIDNFSLKQGSLNIKGKTSVGEELQQFRQALINSSYFKNVRLDTLEKEEIVNFTITADLFGKGGE